MVLKINKVFPGLFLILGLVACQQTVSTDQKDLVKHYGAQLSYALTKTDARLALNSEEVAPRTVDDNNQLNMVPSKDWTSGFFAGELWMMYQLTKDSHWEEKARQYTGLLEREKLNGKTHDMGFKMYCSYGQGYRLTNDKEYSAILLEAANTLTTRYNEKVGCIRSWDHNADKWDFPVIIDNMMNLELLYWASRFTGTTKFSEIATTHATTTLKNHFRDDFSSYHVVDYNPETGEINTKTTHQGYAPESSWARGQAWALYGYTMVYRETKQDRFLVQAERIADFIINHPRLPIDLIPYWDFDAPAIPDEPRDASAAAIISSALYELAGFSSKGEVYISVADGIFDTLSSDNYLAVTSENEGFLLRHSVGSKAHDSEVDVPLVYADYYYLESYLRKTLVSNNKHHFKSKN